MIGNGCITVRGSAGRRMLFAVLAALVFVASARPASAYDIGVFYFPGWLTGSAFWKDLQGSPGSRSPGVPWPEREPLLGFNYPEEAVWVAEKEIDWASSHGITFFAFDWYWLGTHPETEHAEQAFLKAKNRGKMRFCLHWANHNEAPRTMQEFDDMVQYWQDRYFSKPEYYSIDGRPVVFVFSPDMLARQSMVLRTTPQALLDRAQAAVRTAGGRGIYFIATTNERPGDVAEKRLRLYGFQAYTGWNYVRSKDGSRVADYDSMVDTYLDFYRAAAGTKHQLPYIVPASPGFDDRPWFGSRATVRSDPTPAKFVRMLTGAKVLLDDPHTSPKVLMIEAWNEYDEGSVIAPTKKWGTQYIDAIRKVFGP